LFQGPTMTPPSRRDALRWGTGLAALLGGPLPLMWSRSAHAAELPGKPELTVLNHRPWNAETPATLLDDAVTPIARHFVRNNGLPSARAESGSLEGWTLTLDGEVEQPLELTLDELKANYPHVTQQVVLECGGNGRAGFWPKAKGNAWTLGAVGCASYTGVRLADVLATAGVTERAVYVAYYGEDRHLSGDPNKVVISRGVPIAKALDPSTLLVWAMNGEPLPAMHGFPLRMLAPGFPASASGKWLKRLWVRDQVHDGPKMTGMAYRVPEHPVAPGTPVPESDMRIIEEMPVKSLITAPGTGSTQQAGRPFEVRGHAWCGSGDVAAVHVSTDFGATWIPAELAPPANPFAWQRWSVTLRLPTAGHFNLWARATDTEGRAQPMIVPGWNPKGYLNNAMHRIDVQVTP